MDRTSVRWPLPRDTIEWVIGLPAMLVMVVLFAVWIALSTPLAWLVIAIGLAFFTWLSDLANRKVPSLRTRARYLMCVGAVVGFVLGMPFSR